jgi:hypothetical protein
VIDSLLVNVSTAGDVKIKCNTNMIRDFVTGFIPMINLPPIIDIMACYPLI